MASDNFNCILICNGQTTRTQYARITDSETPVRDVSMIHRRPYKLVNKMPPMVLSALIAMCLPAGCTRPSAWIALLHSLNNRLLPQSTIPGLLSLIHI